VLRVRSAPQTARYISLLTDWIKLFVAKDPAFDVANMSRLDYEHIFAASVREYDSIIGTNSPDLSEFRASGGKIIAYHGLVSVLCFFEDFIHNTLFFQVPRLTDLH
jgi:feruloyl esterase